jgi:hypothetical protein
MAGRFKYVALGVVAIGLAMGVAFGLGVAYGKGDEPASQGGLTQQQVNQILGIGAGGAGAGGAGAGGAGAGGAGASGTGGAGSGNAQAGGNTAAAASARATSGKITAVQGQTVTIEIRPGLTQKLNLASTSVVNKYSTGNGSDLKEGSSVLVSGTRKDDGSFDVATINIVPPELAAMVPAAAAGGTTPGAPTAPAATASPAVPAPAGR